MSVNLAYRLVTNVQYQPIIAHLVMQVKTENFQAQIVFRWQDFIKTQLILLHLVTRTVSHVQDQQLSVQVVQHQCI